VDQIAALAGEPEVLRIEPDFAIRKANGPAQASFGVAKARLDVPGLDGNTDGSPSYSAGDLVAAVVDTGIDSSHVDLDGGKVIAFVDCHDRPCEAAAPFDGDGHGTHIAATLAGEGQGNSALAGVAPGAALVGVRVLDSEGEGTSADAIAGLDYVMRNRSALGVEGINLSLGDDSCATSGGLDALSQAVNAASAAGIVVAAAAGNSGPGQCSVGSPAGAPGALTVGAMADLEFGGFYLAGFSSRGPTVDGRVKPDVVGPGVAIDSAGAGTRSGYRQLNGTSMASPFALGVSLLMREVDPRLDPEAVRGIVRRTAVDWGPAGPDSDYGAGRLDAHAALRAAGAAVGAPPAVPGHRTLSGTLGLAGSEELPFQVSDPRFPIAVTIGWPGLVSNLQATLLSPSGQPLASSSTSMRQTLISHRPSRSGVYRLRLSSVLGGHFVADLSAGFSAPAAVLASARRPASAAAPAARALAARIRRRLRRLGRRRIARLRRFRVAARAPAPGSYSVRVLVLRKGRRAVSLATGKRRFARAGSARLTMTLTRRGRRLLAAVRRPRLQVRATFTPRGGAPGHEVTTFRVR
jgi:serine protease AprX